jgi:hypothetical protein
MAVHHNRRAFPRQPARGSVVARVGRFGVGRSLRGSLVNMSQTGVLIELPEPVEPGKDVELEMVPYGAGRTSTMQATVRRCVARPNGGWEIGCQFFSPIAYALMMLYCGGVGVVKR